MTERQDYHERRAFKERELSLMSADPIASMRHAELAALHEAAAANVASQVNPCTAIEPAPPTETADDS